MFQIVEFQKKSTRSNSIFFFKSILPVLYDRYGTIDFKNLFMALPDFFFQLFSVKN